MGVNFRGAELAGARLRGSELFGADFSHAEAARADFSNTQLTAANFRGGDSARRLPGRRPQRRPTGRRRFAGADFSGADLSRADIRGSDLSRVRNLTQEQVNNACADSSTRLPARLSNAGGCSGARRYVRVPVPPRPPVAPAPRHIIGFGGE
ncbi:pentapeptide repeat-containing protein [Brevundimonas denitrificans]|uniref:pentapeptide repeat-containing protein n=1 Tax=Brevundimonas denitrificans TaxID=1443434 RepID=UPI003FA3BCC1